jgi:hypothetical protein
MVKNAINLKTPASGALIALRRETYVGTLSHLGVRVFVYPNISITSQKRDQHLWHKNLYAPLAGILAVPKLLLKETSSSK